MQSILLPVEQHKYMESVFTTTFLTAERFGSRVDAVAMQPNIVDYIAPDPVVVVLPQPDEPDNDSEQKARELFNDFCTRKGLSQEPTANGTRFIWKDSDSIDAISIGASGRVHDITVLGRPGVGRNEPRMSTLESALFESGRSVLMAPPNPPETIGEHILIHWNASVESARAISGGLQFMRQAKQVTILNPETESPNYPTANDLSDYLAEHDIKCEIDTVDARNKNQGEIALRETERLGCDLILKGAYTQSRLRQMIFGGATNHLLQSSPIPILFRH